MSFPAAFQSAIFYILACTPCNSVRHRHKVKLEAKKEKKEKAKLEMEQPGLYRHPSPYNTNPYWQEEIRMGPSLPPKKSTSKNSSQRGLMSAGGESSVSVSDRTLGPAESRAHFDETLTAMVEEVDMLSDDWNKRRGYQREDEELWGEGEGAGHSLMDALSKARDSAGKLIVSTLGKEKEREREREITDEDRRAFYMAPRNPPVNDYHPPVVSSKPLHKNGHKWMLQPPPSAKVMEGKVPVSRTASSGSKSSGKTTLVGEDIQLSRLVHDKLLKDKLLNHSYRATADEEEILNSLLNLHPSNNDNNHNNDEMELHRTRSLSFEAAREMIDTSLYFDRPKSKGRVRAPDLESEDEFEDIFAPRVSHSASQSSNKLGRTVSRPAANPRTKSTRSTRSTRSKLSRRQMSTKMRRQLASPVGDDSD